MQHRMRVRRDPRADDLGFSMLATVLSLLGVAILTALLLGSTLKSGSSSSTNIDNATGVAAADGLQAQQALSSGLTAADSAAASQGGYGSLDVATLGASNPSLTFVSGPSTNTSTVSVAIVTDGSGAITLADRASDGTCWLVWRSPGTAAWYGAQKGLASCTAPALASAPTPGPVSSSAIGWQQASFPAA